jgi:hypothetical protein
VRLLSLVCLGLPVLELRRRAGMIALKDRRDAPAAVLAFIAAHTGPYGVTHRASGGARTRLGQKW